MQCYLVGVSSWRRRGLVAPPRPHAVDDQPCIISRHPVLELRKPSAPCMQCVTTLHGVRHAPSRGPRILQALTAASSSRHSRSVARLQGVATKAYRPPTRIACPRSAARPDLATSWLGHHRQRFSDGDVACVQGACILSRHLVLERRASDTLHAACRPCAWARDMAMQHSVSPATYRLHPFVLWTQKFESVMHQHWLAFR